MQHRQQVSSRRSKPLDKSRTKNESCSNETSAPKLALSKSSLTSSRSSMGVQSRLPRPTTKKPDFLIKEPAAKAKSKNTLRLSKPSEAVDDEERIDATIARLERLRSLISASSKAPPLQPKSPEKITTNNNDSFSDSSDDLVYVDSNELDVEYSARIDQLLQKMDRVFHHAEKFDHSPQTTIVEKSTIEHDTSHSRDNNKVQSVDFIQHLKQKYNIDCEADQGKDELRAHMETPTIEDLKKRYLKPMTPEVVADLIDYNDASFDIEVMKKKYWLSDKEDDKNEQDYVRVCTPTKLKLEEDFLMVLTRPNEAMITSTSCPEEEVMPVQLKNEVCLDASQCASQQRDNEINCDEPKEAEHDSEDENIKNDDNDILAMAEETDRSTDLLQVEAKAETMNVKEIENSDIPLEKEKETVDSHTNTDLESNKSNCLDGIIPMKLSQSQTQSENCLSYGIEQELISDKDETSIGISEKSDKADETFDQTEINSLQPNENTSTKIAEIADGSQYEECENEVDIICNDASSISLTDISMKQNIPTIPLELNEIDKKEERYVDSNLSTSLISHQDEKRKEVALIHDQEAFNCEKTVDNNLGKETLKASVGIIDTETKSKLIDHSPRLFEINQTVTTNNEQFLQTYPDNASVEQKDFDIFAVLNDIVTAVELEEKHFHSENLDLSKTWSLDLDSLEKNDTTEENNLYEDVSLQNSSNCSENKEKLNPVPLNETDTSCHFYAEDNPEDSMSESSPSKDDVIEPINLEKPAVTSIQTTLSDIESEKQELRENRERPVYELELKPIAQSVAETVKNEVRSFQKPAENFVHVAVQCGASEFNTSTEFGFKNENSVDFNQFMPKIPSTIADDPVILLLHQRLKDIDEELKELDDFIAQKSCE